IAHDRLHLPRLSVSPGVTRSYDRTKGQLSQMRPTAVDSAADAKANAEPDDVGTGHSPLIYSPGSTSGTCSLCRHPVLQLRPGSTGGGERSTRYIEGRRTWGLVAAASSLRG